MKQYQHQGNDSEIQQILTLKLQVHMHTAQTSYNRDVSNNKSAPVKTQSVNQ